MNERTTKWAILGPGKIAKKFATGLKYVEGAELYAVASRSKERADAFAEEFNATNAYYSYTDMLKDEKVDVVYIATPHVFHFDNTILCLEHGKAVLCEKPFAMDTAQVKEMIGLAREKKIFLMEALWTQFLPHFQFVMDLLKTEKYGKLKKIKADFGFHSPFNEDHRLYNKALGGGSLLDIGIYPVFTALNAIGIPDEISAKAKLTTTEVDEECEIFFTFKNGVEAELHSTVGRETPTTATFFCENAEITMNSRFHEPTSVSISTKDGIETKDFNVTSNGYNFEAAHVQEMLKQGRTESDQMTFEKSLQLIGLLDEVRKKINLVY
ncbi:Gfo/Idh/MocA family oxidoreductase [Salegentibacter sp. F188]|uniref:Gfo/Idh/MocA family oxidoreductase n=1 Tax=Autumnicola patrickiae TaxID=3075591 RepID=A0ABU3E3U1_9FLAO|nr:Gfo/Idh/MocA family oxidoreductase [Salegentibacter sp. F188]MDT0690663.1 Gfo/Idh/MocA family oxidoreductase [Salegentibacter sp. F188]